MGWTGGILKVVGRLRPGVTLPQAQAEMNVLARNLQAQYPEMNRDRGIRVDDFARDLVGNYRERLFILLGAVGFVLLIACANVANLLLARSAGRSQELAVRAALGASRVRIVRQLLTESLLTGILGAAFGLAIASVLLELVGKLGLDAVPRLNQARLNAPVFLFAFALAIGTTLLSGLLPALRAAQVDIQSVLRRGGRGAGVAHDPARHFYIAGEVALALVLLVCAGLLIRTAAAVAHTQPGFAPKHLITGRTALPSTAYPNATETVAAYQRILRSLREQPAVVAAALTSKVPLTPGAAGLSIKQNSVTPPVKQDIAAEIRYISDGYLATMRIPLLEGRDFNSHDKPDSAQVVLVNHSLAQRLWPNTDAVGQSIRIPEMEGRGSKWQVIGVAADVRSSGTMSEAPPVIYFPFTQIATNPWHWVEQSLYLVARTHTDSVDALPLLAHALANTDPRLPIGDVQTMEQRMARAAEIARFYTWVLTILGGCGLLLTMAGIYGVVSYFVNRRRADIGIRLALGSSRTGVLLLVIKQGMRPVMAGAIVGLGCALITSRVLASQLYGVKAADPETLLVATFLLLAAAALACYLPGRQAANVDPMVTLRDT
jgi:predicted permease